MLEEAPDWLTWLVEDLQPTEAGLTPAQKGERVAAILETLKETADGVVRHEECRRLSALVGIPLELLWERIRPKTAPARPARAPAAPGTTGNARALSGGEIPAAERRALQILMSQPEQKPLILGTLTVDHLTHPLSRRLVERLGGKAETSELVDFQRQIADLTEEERSLVSEIALEEQPPADTDSVRRLLRSLEKSRLKRDSEAVQSEIVRAEVAGDKRLENELIRRKEQIAHEIAALARETRRKGNELGD
jgi:DNA primase